MHIVVVASEGEEEVGSSSGLLGLELEGREQGVRCTLQA
jgi:hypothetical protein